MPPDAVHIRRAGKVCVICDTAFQDGDTHYSVLRYNDAEQEWMRSDYCLACWEQALEGESGTTVHSLWRTRYVDRDAARRTPPNEYTPLLEICYDALSSEDAEQQSLAYLTAMVLRRQKVFRLVRREQDEATQQEAYLFFDKVNQVEVRVPDPPMSLDSLRATRRVLQSRLAPLTEAPGDGALDQEVVHEPD